LLYNQFQPIQQALDALLRRRRNGRSVRLP